ncbi:MAG: hypothetical protein AAB393_03925 [Bacteroidota bacterium]
MNHKGLLISIALALVVFSVPSTGRAQQQDSVNAVQEELQSLSRIFNSLNAGDTVYTPFFPMWSVHDRGLKLRIFSAFRNHGIKFAEDEPVLVIATPDQQEIANLKIGNSSFGRMMAKFVLARDLHETILARQYSYIKEVPVGYAVE